MNKNIMDVILAEWCKHIPKGFPTMENGRFTNEKELLILETIVSDKIEQAVFSKRLINFINEIINLHSELLPCFRIFENKSLKNYEKKFKHNIKETYKKLKVIQNNLKKLRVIQEKLELQANEYSSKSIKKIIDACNIHMGNLTNSINILTNKEFISEINKINKELDHAPSKNTIKMADVRDRLKINKSAAQYLPSPTVIFQNLKTPKQIGDIDTEVEHHELLHNRTITPENLKKYCLAKLVEPADAEAAYKSIIADTDIMKLIIGFINGNHSLDETLNFINKHMNKRAFKIFAMLKGGRGSGIDNMGRGEIPVIILMKTALKAKDEGDVEIEGKLYEVKEKSPVRAGTKYKKSIASFIQRILSINEYLNKQKAMSKFIGSNKLFRKALSAEPELVNYTDSKRFDSAASVWNAIISRPDSPEDRVVDSDDEAGNDVDNPNLNTIGSGKIVRIFAFLRVMSTFKHNIETQLDNFKADTFSIKDPDSEERDPITNRRAVKSYKLDSDDVTVLRKVEPGERADIDPERISSPENYRAIEAFVNKFDVIIPPDFSFEKFKRDTAIEFIEPYDGLIYITNQGEFKLFNKQTFLKSFVFRSISQMTRPQFYYKAEAPTIES